MKNWILSKWHGLVNLEASPEEIAGGLAVGLWWGFTPLFGLKTLLAVCTAWITGLNKTAAVVGVTLLDILLPLSPFLLLTQYEIGCQIIHVHPVGEHELFHWAKGGYHSWVTWDSFHKFCEPLILGGLLFGTLCSMISFIAVRSIVAKIHSSRCPSPATSK